MKNFLYKIVNDIFYISLITFVAFFVLELLKEGLISNYFDLNLLLICLIIFGVINLNLNKSHS